MFKELYIYIYEGFSMNEIHTELPFLCDYVRNGYCNNINGRK